ncbi:MAG: hypothetical protein K2H12_11265 [Acetatifactor sp.]|nr:hypothetical protein [Acetatifactor sp.]
MGIWHGKKKHKQNNAGSAIVTVLVVVTFITILATVMLYISGLNFQMKATDYRTKESFYQAEIPVEELRSQLVKDMQIAFAKAYTAAMSEYAGLGNKENREASYRQHFCDELNKIWKERCGLIADSNNLDWGEGIRKVVQPAADGGYWSVKVAEASGWDTSRAVSNGQVILRGVTFTYDSPTHYESDISTDYCITIPPINWSDVYEPSPTSSPTPMDFSGYVNYMNWTKS